MLELFVIIIFTEAITELAVKSEFFESLRKKLFESEYKLLNYIHKIFDCGYCFSVWAAMFTLILFIINNIFINYFMIGIVIHRLSNMFHFLMDRINSNKV